MTPIGQGDSDSGEGKTRCLWPYSSLSTRLREGNRQLDFPSRLGDQYQPGDHGVVRLARLKVAQVG